MQISLDYDDTYTRDPAAWDEFIALMQRNGHNVYCVTFRSKESGKEVVEALGKKVDGIFFTDRASKRKYLADRGIWIDVFVDDMPEFVVSGLPERN